MPKKIPLNGTGRLGRLAMTAQAWSFLMAGYRRALTNILEVERQREEDELDRLHGLERTAQTYALIRQPDDSFKFKLPDSACCDVYIDGEIPKDRYHDRTFPKDYAKKKKAKRRHQKQGRKNRKR
mgnify:CR=1 FL=1